MNTPLKLSMASSLAVAVVFGAFGLATPAGADAGNIHGGRHVGNHSGHHQWNGGSHSRHNNFSSYRNYDDDGDNYGRRHHRHRGLSFGGISIDLGDGGNEGCRYSYRKWQATGSSYWRTRYYDCVG